MSRHARAAGGHLIHEVVNGTARCGHKPYNSPTSSMNRGRWIYYDRPVTCNKCKAAIAKTWADSVARIQEKPKC